MSTKVKVTNNFKATLRVGLAYNEKFMVSSHEMRMTLMKASHESGVSLGFKSFNISNSSGSGKEQVSHHEKTEEWHWRNYITPGSLLLDSGESHVFSVSTDKPIFYITIVHPDGNEIFAENVPIEASVITINSKGVPVPDDTVRIVKKAKLDELLNCFLQAYAYDFTL
jgi:hypothetical protein